MISKIKTSDQNLFYPRMNSELRLNMGKI